MSLAGPDGAFSRCPGSHQQSLLTNSLSRPLPAPPRERKPAKPRGPRKRENRSEYLRAWYAKNQARIIEKRRAERVALKSHHDAPLAPDAPNRIEATRKKSKAALQ